MIKMLVMDVDGTLTDGSINIGNSGELYKSFNVLDGYGIAKILPQLGITPVIITGRQSTIVARRAAELGISEVFQGIENKLNILVSLAAEKGVKASEIACIGDDLNDLDCLQYAAISGCPANAHKAVKDVVSFISIVDGGKGAVREFIDYLATIYN